MQFTKQDDPLEADRSGLSVALVDMMGPDTARALMKDMYRGERFRRVDARIRQKRIAKEMKLGEKRHGLKRTGARYIAEIDFDSFIYWQEREGRECWKDRGFLREFLRDNEDVRVAQATGGATNRTAWTPAVDRAESAGLTLVPAGKYTTLPHMGHRDKSTFKTIHYQENGKAA
jgi:hypothetical protein